jgi:adenine-specific DNA-methyltransferase
VAERLLDDLAVAGARFDGTMRFCDPACGGGAFLLPVARRIADRLEVAGGSASDLARCLIGIDIDPGGLAITRAALDALARDRFGTSARWDLRRDNTLRLAVEGRLPAADVVVGNPPFGASGWPRRSGRSLPAASRATPTSTVCSSTSPSGSRAGWSGM